MSDHRWRIKPTHVEKQELSQRTPVPVEPRTSERHRALRASTPQGVALKIALVVGVPAATYFVHWNSQFDYQEHSILATGVFWLTMCTVAAGVLWSLLMFLFLIIALSTGRLQSGSLDDSIKLTNMLNQMDMAQQMRNQTEILRHMEEQQRMDAIRNHNKKP